MTHEEARAVTKLVADEGITIAQDALKCFEPYWQEIPRIPRKSDVNEVDLLKESAPAVVTSPKNQPIVRDEQIVEAGDDESNLQDVASSDQYSYGD